MGKSKWLIPLLLLGVAPLTLAALTFTQAIDAEVASATARSLAWTSGGGILTGITIGRFLALPRRDSEQIFGLALATALGTLTIGGLYLVLLPEPMATIGTPARTVEQMTSFIQFLMSQAAGIVITLRYLQAR